MAQLRLLVVGRDPDVAGVDYVEQRLSRLYELPDLYLLARRVAVARRRDDSVAEIQLGRLDGGAGQLDACDCDTRP